MKRRGGRRKVCLLGLLLASLAAAAVALVSGGIWPEASGNKVLTDGDLTVDASHLDEGYIMARGPSTERRLKLRIAKDDVTLTYDLNQEGNYETFPLQLGDGEYLCTLYRCVEGKKYSQEGAVRVQGAGGNNAFLCPNQYVNYTQDSPAVQMSEELCNGLTTQEEKYKAIHDYIVKNFTYDYVRAINANEVARMPDVDGTFERRSGICQDLSALAVCMLRVQGIPARLEIGYANNNYHAWLTAEVDGEEKFFDPTAEVSAMGKSIQYSVERYY